MSKARLALLGSLLAFGTAAQAASLDLNINDDTVRAEYDAPLPNNRLNMNVGILHHEESGNDADALTWGLQAVERVQNRYTVGVGGRAYLFDTEVEDAGALALGAYFRQHLLNLPRFSFGGHLFYAPKVLAFDEAESLLDLGVRAYYQALQEVDLYVGYRKFDIDFEKRPERTIDDEFNIGFVLHF